jgi:protein dithiol oxidoreductase (disulfide-forming)
LFIKPCKNAINFTNYILNYFTIKMRENLMKKLFAVASLSFAVLLTGCSSEESASVNMEVAPVVKTEASAVEPVKVESMVAEKAVEAVETIVEKTEAADVAIEPMVESAPKADKPKRVFVEGVHYKVLPNPVKVRLKEGQVAVVQEFFQYTCGHCYNFHPMISNWEKTVESDVTFEMLPVWAVDPYAKAYWAAEYMELGSEFHDAVYAKIHGEKNRMGSMSDFAELAALYGADKDKFTSTAESFAVMGQITKANQAMAAAGQAVERIGTPAMLVNGQYLVMGSTAGSNATMLEVIDFLTDKARDDKK